MLFFKSKNNSATSNEKDFERIKKELAIMVKMAIGKRFVDQFATQCKLTNPQPIVGLLKRNYNELPDRQLLRRIADNSEGRVTFKILYDICGYSERDQEEDRTWMNWTPKRGEIYYCDLGWNIDSEQSGIKPVLIIQNDVGNKFSPSVVVIPCTSKCKFSQKIHTYLDKNEFGLLKHTYILNEQIKSISKRRFFYNGGIPFKVTTLTEQKLLEVQLSLEFELGFQSLMFDENEAFRMVEHIKTLQENIRVKRSHNLLDLLDEKVNELISYCEKYRKDHKLVMQEYDRLNNYAYQAI